MRAACLVGALAFSVVALQVASQVLAAEPEAAPAELALSQRIEIFRALVDAEVRADHDAAEQMEDDPESPAQVELADKLLREYRAKVIRDYGITQERAEDIVEEGYAKAWPVSPGGPVEDDVD